MLTIRQIERLWNAGDFARLARELLAGRAELSPRTLLDSSYRVPCAAMALIRIDEFAQNFHPLAGRLIKVLVSAQDPDGGWGDPATTALVLRALSTSRGHGLSVSRGLAFLGAMQKEDGLFPAVPLKRTAGDAHVTSLILLHLTHVPNGTAAINLPLAHAALAKHQPTLITRGLIGATKPTEHPNPTAQVRRRADLAVA